MNIQNNKFDFVFPNTQESMKYVSEYLEDIYQNLIKEEKELKIKPKYGYMEKQPDINEQMREILIDWLIQVHLRFSLRPETLYQTIFIIDSFSSLNTIIRSKYQLLGIASLLISCKSQEIYFPQLKEFIQITDNAYNKNELIVMENDILKILNFNILYPTSNDFYNILAKFFDFDQKQYYLGKYLLDVALVDYQMIKYPASVIAAGSAYLVMKFFVKTKYKLLYNDFFVDNECPEKIIKEVAADFCNLIKNASKSKLRGVKMKYSISDYSNIAEFLEHYLNQ